MARIITVIRKDAAVAELAKMAQDWQAAANGQPLTHIKASVALMLADFAGILEMGPDEIESLLKMKTEIQ